MSDAGQAERKATLRREILAQLRQMDAADRATRSASICRQLVESESWQRSRAVALFSPMRVEPDISPLAITAAESAKLVTAIPSDIRDEAALELPFTPDLILVPGVAFSRDGHRLGRGGGFYDRLLAGRARDAFKIGVCFAAQLVASVPFEQHDVMLDAVISE